MAQVLEKGRQGRWHLAQLVLPHKAPGGALNTISFDHWKPEAVRCYAPPLHEEKQFRGLLTACGHTISLKSV